MTPGALSTGGTRLVLLLVAALPGACRRVEPSSLEGLPRFTLEAELAVDGFIPDLGPIRWMGAASDGTIAVAQVDDHLVRLLDPSGQDVGSVGGHGGEVGMGGAGAPLQGGGGWIGDTLWVSDATLGRIAMYSKGLEFSRSLPPLSGARPRPGEESLYPDFLQLWPVFVFPGDTLLVLAAGAVGGPEEGAWREGKHLLRITPGGGILRHLLQVSVGSAPNAGSSDRESVWALAPPSEVLLYHVAPTGDRIAVIDRGGDGAGGGRWRLRVVDAYGRDVLDRLYRFQGDPVPRGVVVGEDHRIWIELQEASGELWGVALSPEGEPVGRLSLPPEARLLEAAEAYVWVSQLGPGGAPEAVRYRMTLSG